MIRILSAIALCALLVVSSATPAVGDTGKNSTGCEATSGRNYQSGWKLGCGSGGTCTTGGCQSAVTRDALGEFIACRCPTGGASPCCQVILRVDNGNTPDSMGECASCGKSGDCELFSDEVTVLTTCTGAVGRN